MGCDIHMITEVRKDGKWQRISENPEKWKERNYSTFAVLADVRNDFHVKGFEPRGLPEDLSAKKFDFVSETDSIKKRYENDTLKMVMLPSGQLVGLWDSRFDRVVESREKADEYEGGWRCEDGKYIVHDPSLLSGEIKCIPVKELKPYEEYIKTYEDDWDKDANDYGYWRIDFDSPDYHSHSWLTLQELLDYDQSDYLAIKIRVPKIFFDKFKEFGGVLPEQIKVMEPTHPKSIIEAIQMGFNPEVIVKIDGEDKRNEYPIQQGINELVAISQKYEVQPSDIRIVFAFDN